MSDAEPSPAVALQNQEPGSELEGVPLFQGNTTINMPKCAMCLAVPNSY